MSRNNSSNVNMPESNGLRQMTLNNYYENRIKDIKYPGYVDSIKAAKNIRFLVVNPRGFNP